MNVLDSSGFPSGVAERQALLASLRECWRARNCLPASLGQAADSGDWQEFETAVWTAVLASPADDQGELSAAHLGSLWKLRTAGSESPAEFHVCRFSLAWRVEGPASVGWPELENLAHERLWEPVHTLAYRLFAIEGRRHTLATFLPRSGPLTLAQADAWLEAVGEADSEAGWLDRIQVDPAIPGAVAERWLGLLRAETDLALGRGLEQVEAKLKELAATAAEGSPAGFAEAHLRYVAARAAAAMKRLELTGYAAGFAGRTLDAERWLPHWERLYLDGLRHWYHGQRDAAEQLLVAAVDSAPCQTPARLALAGLQAPARPETALATLATDQPTREILVSRAALEARLGRPEVAAVILDQIAQVPSPGSEPLRFSWARGRAQTRRQEQLLRTALAELDRNWAAARTAWRTACDTPGQATLHQTRDLWELQQELSGDHDSPGLRGSVASQRLNRAQREVMQQTLLGDALFFRALSLADQDPERACRDLRTLLRQQRWTKRELGAGAGRLLCVGDHLLRHGQTDAAIQVYELATAVLGPAPERLAVAMLCRELQTGAELSAWEPVLQRATQLAPESPWPPLVQALGLMIAGNSAASNDVVEIAARRHAPEPACRLLRRLLGSPQDEPTAHAASVDGPASVSPATNALVQLVSSAGTLPERVQEFLGFFGEEWINHCPYDPVRLTRRLTAGANVRESWERLAALAEGLLRAGMPGAEDIAALVRVGRALETARQGRLEEAARELEQIVGEIERLRYQVAAP